MHAVAPIFGDIFFQMYFFPIIQYAYLQSEKFSIGQNPGKFFFIFFWKSLHNFQEKDAFACPIENFSDLWYFPVIHQKRVRRLFIFFWKSLHYFWKKDAFGAVERHYKKKTLGKFSRILPYWKLFGLVIFSSYSSKACKTSFYFFFKKLALFLKKDAFGAVERRLLKKKHLENFPGCCPIGNFSDL